MKSSPLLLLLSLACTPPQGSGGKSINPGVRGTQVTLTSTTPTTSTTASTPSSPTSSTTPLVDRCESIPACSDLGAEPPVWTMEPGWILGYLHEARYDLTGDGIPDATVSVRTEDNEQELLLVIAGPYGGERLLPRDADHTSDYFLTTLDLDGDGTRELLMEVGDDGPDDGTYILEAPLQAHIEFAHAIEGPQAGNLSDRNGDGVVDRYMSGDADAEFWFGGWDTFGGPPDLTLLDGGCYVPNLDAGQYSLTPHPDVDGDGLADLWQRMESPAGEECGPFFFPTSARGTHVTRNSPLAMFVDPVDTGADVTGDGIDDFEYQGFFYEGPVVYDANGPITNDPLFAEPERDGAAMVATGLDIDHDGWPDYRVHDPLQYPYDLFFYAGGEQGASADPIWTVLMIEAQRFGHMVTDGSSTQVLFHDSTGVRIVTMDL